MTTKPKLPQSRKPSERDMFQTPDYATELLVPFIPKHVKFVWESASGEGKIARVLLRRGYDVTETDLFPPSTNERCFWMDFLGGTRSLTDESAIITNPPYSSKKQFFLRALEYGVPVAMLIPFDLSRWICDAFDAGCQALVPNRRINYITPSGKAGTESRAQFHSAWLTYKFNLPNQLTIVDLSLDQIKNNI